MAKPDENSRIRLDTVSLETRASLYPEELREPFVWLGSFLREECNRDFDILHARAGKLGITIDKTNWSKILRGRWDRAADDTKLDSPIIAVAKLLKAIDALRKDARIKAQSGKIPFVETTTTRDIFLYVDKKRSPDRVCKFGVVIGETGNQKTAAFREYCLRNNHGACVWVDAPETPSMTQFITDLASQYGSPTQGNWTRKKWTIREAVNERKTIIVENVQRLYNPKLEGNQPIFNYLQKLQEGTGCTIIISYTPTFHRTFTAGLHRGFFEQFVGRAGGEKGFLRLEDYPPEEDVLEIIKAFGLREADKHLDYCAALAREPGRIRVLFETLQEAKIRAESKKEALTIGHLKWVRDED